MSTAKTNPTLGEAISDGTFSASAMGEGTPFTLDAQGWVLIAVMVIGPQLLGHTMINFALDRIAPTTVSVATLMEPIGSALLAWWLLSEAPTSGVWIGAPIAIVGLVIVVLAGRDD